MLEDQRERTRGDVIARKLVVIEVVKRGIVGVADVDDGGGRIGEIGGSGLAAHDGCGALGEEDAAGKELVFVGTAGVGEDRRKRRHERCMLRNPGRGARNSRGVAWVLLVIYLQKNAA